VVVVVGLEETPWSPSPLWRPRWWSWAGSCSGAPSGPGGWRGGMR